MIHVCPGPPEPMAQHMTKREAFAMAAMQGLMSNPSVIGPNPTCGWSYVNCTPEQLSLCAIDQADALLRELAKDPNV
jgi:hypothetical protein